MNEKEVKDLIAKENLRRDMAIAMVLIGYVTLPIWLPINTLRYMFLSLLKPLHIMNEKVTKNKEYWLNNSSGKGKSYNPFEYLWASIEVRSR